MPELPEIEMVRRAVGPRLVGRTVVSADVRQPKVVAHPDVDDFLDRIVGRTFTSLDRRGKYLIAVLDDGQRIVMHMRMTGCLLVTPADMPEERHTHIVMPLDDGSQLRFSDMRRFGRFWLFRKDEDDDISGVSKLGPEPSDPSLDPDYLKDRLGSCRRAIKDCLLDQSVVAGIGNIYSDEILFDTGIDPSCPANILSDEDWMIKSTLFLPLLLYFNDYDTFVFPSDQHQTDLLSPPSNAQTTGKTPCKIRKKNLSAQQTIY